jgi:hypothetical protein
MHGPGFDERLLEMVIERDALAQDQRAQQARMVLAEVRINECLQALPKGIDDAKPPPALSRPQAHHPMKRFHGKKRLNALPRQGRAPIKLPGIPRPWDDRPAPLNQDLITIRQVLPMILQSSAEPSHNRTPSLCCAHMAALDDRDLPLGFLRAEDLDRVIHHHAMKQHRLRLM